MDDLELIQLSNSSYSGMDVDENHPNKLNIAQTEKNMMTMYETITRSKNMLLLVTISGTIDFISFKPEVPNSVDNSDYNPYKDGNIDDLHVNTKSDTNYCKVIASPSGKAMSMTCYVYGLDRPTYSKNS